MQMLMILVVSFLATFENISATSWRSREHRRNHRSKLDSFFYFLLVSCCIVYVLQSPDETNKHRDSIDSLVPQFLNWLQHFSLELLYLEQIYRTFERI